MIRMDETDKACKEDLSLNRLENELDEILSRTADIKTKMVKMFEIIDSPEQQPNVPSKELAIVPSLFKGHLVVVLVNL